MKNFTKISLALVLFLCLLDMPYGYYQFVRFSTTMLFSYLAYSSKKQDDESNVFVYIFLAVLFQPIFKVALGRTIWNIVDVIVALGLLISIFTNSKPTNHK